MQAYSLDLRQRIVQTLEQGVTKEETAKRFCVSLSSVKRYHRQWKAHENLAPHPLPGRSPIIKDEQHQEFRELVASRTDWTLDSLGDAWQRIKGIKPTVSVLCDTCKRLKITRKKRVASPKKEIPTNVPPFRRR